VKFAVTVEVSGLEGISDPEGQTIERALPLLGFEGVEHMRVGKMFRFEVEAPDAAAARETSDRLSATLLANPVIERADVRVGEPGTAG
jgi:phosphoribosylformylglycinamidine synthase